MVTGNENSWSLGTLVGLPILVLLALFFLGFGVWIIRRREHHYDSAMSLTFGILSLVVSMSFVVGTLLGMYPYNAEYHQWQQTEGVVRKIDKRLLGSGSGMTERFVVTFDSGASRSCDDTRCSLVRPQDYLVLSCKRAWQYTGTDGYDCNYISHKGQ